MNAAELAALAQIHSATSVGFIGDAAAWGGGGVQVSAEMVIAGLLAAHTVAALGSPNDYQVWFTADDVDFCASLVIRGTHLSVYILVPV